MIIKLVLFKYIKLNLLSVKNLSKTEGFAFKFYYNVCSQRWNKICSDFEFIIKDTRYKQATSTVIIPVYWTSIF